MQIGRADNVCFHYKAITAVGGIIVRCCRAGGRLRTMSAKIGSFVKKSYSRNMGHKIGKLPQKSEELAALKV